MQNQYHQEPEERETLLSGSDEERCRTCGERLRREAVYEHAACGRVGLLSDFRTDDGVRCPKCDHASADDSPLDRICDVVVCSGCGRRTDTFPGRLDENDGLAVE